MAALERGLGRGLDSLLRSTREAETATRETHKLALSQLTPGAHQPRKLFDDSALAELSVSIKNQGVVQPLIVRPKEGSMPQMYEIVAGERRWRAAKLAGLTEVPVLVAQYTDVEAMTVALVENLQRENLNPLEEAEALQALREAYGLSQEDLAAKLGKSRSAVANALRLLQLPEAIRSGLASGHISAGHARALLALGDEDAQALLYNAVLQQGLSVRDVESAVEEWKRSGMLPEHVSASVAACEEHKGAAPAKTVRRAPKPQSLKDIQKRLRSAVLQGASISGNEEKGRIALPYTSHGELEFLLHLLGVGLEAGQEPGAGSVLPADNGEPDIPDLTAALQEPCSVDTMEQSSVEPDEPEAEAMAPSNEAMDAMTSDSIVPDGGEPDKTLLDDTMEPDAPDLGILQNPRSADTMEQGPVEPDEPEQGVSDQEGVGSEGAMPADIVANEGDQADMVQLMVENVVLPDAPDGVDAMDAAEPALNADPEDHADPAMPSAEGEAESQPRQADAEPVSEGGETPHDDLSPQALDSLESAGEQA